MQRLLHTMLPLGLSLLLSACQSPMPWQKARLASEQMKPSGPIPAITKLDQHVYTSKEAVKGGTGIGGGGCGCN